MRENEPMLWTPTALSEVWLLTPDIHTDDRGFLARLWCQREASLHGLDVTWLQSNLSYNHRRGTLRGLHYQTRPHGEAKLVRCLRGTIHDVVLDLRPASVTFGQWLGVELRATHRQALFIPAGLAHGFQTLEDDTEVLYEMSACYQPEAVRGVRWNDPTFAITWPLPVTVISAQDANWPDWRGEP